MDERSLLLLGLLKTQSQHGYQLNEFIEKNLSRVTMMKKPTAYAILERLAEAGYVEMHTMSEGNRPPRKVYAITAAGEQLFQELLRKHLAEADPLIVSGDIAMMFVDDLPPTEAIALLRVRSAGLAARIEVFASAPKHEHGLGVDLALEHALVLLRADAAWLTAVIGRLEERASEDSALAEAVENA